MKTSKFILGLFFCIAWSAAFAQGYFPPAEWSEVDTSLLDKKLAGIEDNVQKMLEAIDEFDFPDSPIDWATNVPANETDPLYSAWDKSSGISITESQISDLQAYLTAVNWGDIGGTLANQTDLQVALDLKANEADLPDTYYTEIEIDVLLANKSNWDTAYSWGDHADEGCSG